MIIFLLFKIRNQESMQNTVSNIFHTKINGAGEQDSPCSFVFLLKYYIQNIPKHHMYFR